MLLSGLHRVPNHMKNNPIKIDTPRQVPKSYVPQLRLTHTLNSLLKTLIAVAMLALLAACAASVKYAPRVPGFQPGYVDERLGEETYRVQIGEAWPKDWGDLEKFAMYRAAEVTRTNGYRFFAIVNSTSQTNTYRLPSTTTVNTQGTISNIGGISSINSTSTATSTGGGTLSGGWFTLDFRLVPDSEARQLPRVVDSEQVMRDLRYFIDSRR
jgi:hypothetical protein